MNKVGLVLLLVLAFSLPAFAFIIPLSEQGQAHSQAPLHSVVIGPDWSIERIDFIHYANGKTIVHPAKPTKPTVCYKLLGYSWKTTPVNYYINPTNSQGLSQSFVTSAFSTAAETWDDATSKELFNNAYAVDTSAVYGVKDGKNSIVFGSYPNSGVIAVTSIWFSRKNQQLVEFDQLYNTYFAWGDSSVNPALMDLQNIAVHELGHGVGLDDIYTSSCSAVTMYGYSYEGDLAKRTLETADITGLRLMYGN